MLNRPEILIVDDHEAIRTGIRSLLAARPQWHICGEAVDGIDAVEKVKALHPDVVLMDISMPRMDGITAMRIVQREAPDSRVIVVTQNDANSLRKESVRADGYVLKVHLHRDLLPAIERVLGSGHNDSDFPASTATATATLPRRTNGTRELQPPIAGDPSATAHARTRELDQRNAEIAAHSEQLQELSVRLQQRQDEERRRIARELHDSAGQLLAVLGMNLGQVRSRIGGNDDAARVLDHSEEIVNQLNSEIRTLSYRLHPPLLDESGLSDAIHWYTKGLAERGNLITVDMPDEFGRLPSDMELALFRIIQECLANVQRHSGSKTATIRLHRDEHRVHLDVQDEGRGIPAETLPRLHRQRTGVGLAGIRERVRHFGGQMHIDSGSRGTTVSVVLPVPRRFDGSSPRDPS